MAGSEKFHDNEAIRFAARAEDLLQRGSTSDQPAQVAAAQAYATLALAHRTAERTALQRAVAEHGLRVVTGISA